MADRYTSRMALVLERPVDDVGVLVDAAVETGDIDRAAPLRGGDETAWEVYWGGRMQRAVVRRLVAVDGEPMLRTEAYIGGDGIREGMRRQAELLRALARQVADRIRAVRDLSARAEHEPGWVNRLASGAVEVDDAIVVAVEGEGTLWARSHGAARFDVPDLELYGLRTSQVTAAEQAIRHVHDQLLQRGLKADLELADGTPVYLVPVLEAWQHLPLEWPGVGRAGQERGPGLAGPRATLSVLHPPRFGRYRTDLRGVIERLGSR